MLPIIFHMFRGGSHVYFSLQYHHTTYRDRSPTATAKRLWVVNYDPNFIAWDHF